LKLRKTQAIWKSSWSSNWRGWKKLFSPTSLLESLCKENEFLLSSFWIFSLLADAVTFSWSLCTFWINLPSLSSMLEFTIGTSLFSPQYRSSFSSVSWVIKNLFSFKSLENLPWISSFLSLKTLISCYFTFSINEFAWSSDTSLHWSLEIAWAKIKTRAWLYN